LPTQPRGAVALGAGAGTVRWAMARIDRALRRERRLAREHLEEDGPEPVEIAAHVGHAPAELLGLAVLMAAVLCTTLASSSRSPPMSTSTGRGAPPSPRPTMMFSS